MKLGIKVKIQENRHHSLHESLDQHLNQKRVCFDRKISKEIETFDLVITNTILMKFD